MVFNVFFSLNNVKYGFYKENFIIVDDEWKLNIDGRLEDYYSGCNFIIFMFWMNIFLKYK